MTTRKLLCREDEVVLECFTSDEKKLYSRFSTGPYPFHRKTQEVTYVFCREVQETSNMVANIKRDDEEYDSRCLVDNKGSFISVRVEYIRYE